MKPLLAKVRPASGFSHLAHIALLAVYPMVILLLVRLDLVLPAFALVLLAKWRMFAVKPRFWWANIRANSVDIIFGLAVLIFMLQTDSFAWQVGWTAVHILWLTLLRPRSSPLMVGIQAMVTFVFGLGALFLVGDTWPALVLVFSTGMICYLAAHHFFDGFDERYMKLLSFFWAFFGASLVWVLSHWLVYYPANGVISQPMLLLITIGYGLAALYYLDHTQRLSELVRNQFIFIMAAITVLILIFSDWGDKIV